jgi:hypothetical protein
MPTLHHRARKNEKASTKVAGLKKTQTRALALRKSPAKKKASRYVKPSVSSDLSRVREDTMDLRMIREARQADKGKARFGVNELRAQRGLAAI